MMRIASTVLISLIILQPFTALADNTCSNTQRNKFEKLADNYFATSNAARKTPDMNVMAGSDGEVHGKNYCRAVDRHIRAGQDLVAFIDRTGCFDPSTRAVWQSRVDETTAEKQKGCTPSPKRVPTQEEVQRGAAQFDAYQACLREAEARGIRQPYKGDCFRQYILGD